MTQYKTYKKSIVPFKTQVAGGSIPGWGSVNKFGRNQTCDADVDEIIWDGSTSTYNWPTSACTISVLSTSASDTASGAGARTLQIYGHNASRLDINEVVTLNGAAAVTTACNYSRVFRMKVLTAGSLGKNQGEIAACANGGGIAYISASKNQTLMAIYSLPANKEGFLHKWYASVNVSAQVAGEREADMTLFIREGASTGVFNVKHFIGINSNGTGTMQYEFDAPLRIAPESDIYIAACCQTANTDVSAGFDIFQKEMT